MKINRVEINEKRKEDFKKGNTKGDLGEKLKGKGMCEKIIELFLREE